MESFDLIAKTVFLAINEVSRGFDLIIKRLIGRHFRIVSAGPRQLRSRDILLHQFPDVFVDLSLLLFNFSLCDGLSIVFSLVLDGVDVASWPRDIVKWDVVVSCVGVGNEGGLPALRMGIFPFVDVLFFVVAGSRLILFVR